MLASVSVITSGVVLPDRSVNMETQEPVRAGRGLGVVSVGLAPESSRNSGSPLKDGAP